MQDYPLKLAIENLKKHEDFWLKFNEANNKIHASFNDCLNKGVLICERDPASFIGALFAAFNAELSVFLGNPDWRQSEWKQVFAQVSPALIFSDVAKIPYEQSSLSRDFKQFSRYLMIPTGGSGGKVRFAMHTLQSLSNSVSGTASFLHRQKLNSLCQLPLYHISGLIQVIRAMTTGGKILFDSLDSFDKDHNFKEFCLSLVPTQLERLMQKLDNMNMLKTFDVIFLGGAPASSDLLNKAKHANLPLSPTYGMTETGSMVAAMDPKDFLAGMTGVGRQLPHANLSINDDGLITIVASSLFSGYFPEAPQPKILWETKDEGIIDPLGYLTIIGRADRIIITGGEKVDPKEVEQAILATNLVSSIIVAGIDDDEWGQRIIAIYVSLINGEDPSLKIKERLKESLVSYKIPKDWIAVDILPYDEKGKITQASINNCVGAHRLLLEESQK